MTVTSDHNLGKNYYEILGVQQEADHATLKRAYQNLSKQYHPDKNPSTTGDNDFKEITRAYRVLSDPVLKRDYDIKETRGIGIRTGRFGAQFEAEDMTATMSEFMAAFDTMKEVLRRNSKEMDENLAEFSKFTKTKSFRDMDGSVDSDSDLFCYHYSRGLNEFRHIWEDTGRRLRQTGWCRECMTKEHKCDHQTAPKTPKARRKTTRAATPTSSDRQTQGSTSERAKSSSSRQTPRGASPTCAKKNCPDCLLMKSGRQTPRAVSPICSKKTCSRCKRPKNTGNASPVRRSRTRLDSEGRNTARHTSRALSPTNCCGRKACQDRGRRKSTYRQASRALSAPRPRKTCPDCENSKNARQTIHAVSPHCSRRTCQDRGEHSNHCKARKQKSKL